MGISNPSADRRLSPASTHLRVHPANRFAAPWQGAREALWALPRDTHRQVLRRRRQWFEQMAEAQAALWWIPRGHTPTTGEAEERVIYLREFGPTPYAFTLRQHFPPPDAAAFGPIRSPEEWTCPA